MNSKAVVTRRTAIGAAVAAAAPLLFPGRIRAQGAAAPPDTFVILLDGPYEPVVHGPNLGLSTVDLSDGSYSKTRIYPFSGGTPGNTDRNKAIGDFYAQFTGENTVCAYHIPGGSFAMRFIDNLRTDDTRGNRDLPVIRRRSQPHGRPSPPPRHRPPG